MGKHKLKTEELENSPQRTVEEPDAKKLLKSPKELVGDADTWNEKCAFLVPIAHPLASRSLGKDLYKLIRKASRTKGSVRKGVREVQKFIRKGEKGIVLLAGNTRPIDVIAHMPVVCEEAELPYCFAPSKQDLGLACGSRRKTCALLIKANEEYQDLYDKCMSDVKELPTE